MKTKNNELIICPSCGSEEVAREKDFKLGFIAGIFTLFAPLPIFVHKYHCIDCGNIFKSKDIAQIIRK